LTTTVLRSQPTPYANVGLSLEFGFDRVVYFTPKFCIGYEFGNLAFTNLTISYAYSFKSISFWNIYSEFGLSNVTPPRLSSEDSPSFFYGIGAGFSTSTINSVRVTSFRSNYFFGYAIYYLNYVHQIKTEFPDNIGIEGVLPIYAPNVDL